MKEATTPVVGERRFIKRNANLKDISGKRFHRLTVLKEAPGRWCGGSWEMIWWCLCDCGNVVEARYRCLQTGTKKSCGCLLGKNKLNLTGDRYGRLVVLAPGPLGIWECLCDCGVTAWKDGHNMRGGLTKSCGCLHIETIRNRRMSHGLSNTKVYNLWSAIRRRTGDPNHQDYRHYGGRGITMQPEWRESFEVFLADVGQPPSSKHSLDRIKNELGYLRGNVRWATQAEQVRNTRRTIRVTIDGSEMCLKDACEKRGISYKSISKRVREGMDVYAAMAKPVAKLPARPKNFERLKKSALRVAKRGSTRKFVFGRDGNKCVKCGASIELVVDHVVPTIQGGTSRRSNLQTLCDPCNSSKGGWVYVETVSITPTPA